VHSGPDGTASSAQRWRLRLGSGGVVQCESKKAYWPDQPAPPASTLRRLLARWRR
jgi:hypothetical protein